MNGGRTAGVLGRFPRETRRRRRSIRGVWSREARSSSTRSSESCVLTCSGATYFPKIAAAFRGAALHASFTSPPVSKTRPSLRRHSVRPCRRELHLEAPGTHLCFLPRWRVVGLPRTQRAWCKVSAQMLLARSPIYCLPFLLPFLFQQSFLSRSYFYKGFHSQLPWD